jgi:radical SAM superfamily enzyme YgiQ (UPF0313 family)
MSFSYHRRLERNLDACSMRVCLITAPTAAEFQEPEEFSSVAVRAVSEEPQLGILSLAAVLEQRGERCRIVNLNRLFFEHADAGGANRVRDFALAAAAQITGAEAEVYGFGSICSSFPLTIRIAEAVKAIRPRSTILFGGPQASVVDVHCLAAFPFVDLVLRGEAELTLPILLDQLAGERHFEKVLGLTYRDRGQIHRNPSAAVISDLDLLPSPAYHLTAELTGATTAALELGRGCPFACTFCSTNDFFRRKFRLRSPERVLHDMRDIASRYGIRQFGLVHDMFTVDRRRVEAFCDAMLASGDGFKWSCSARTDCVDEELLEHMRRSGCRAIFFGVETGSKRMQKIIDKHLDPDRAKEIIDTAERLGIDTTVSLITGFPEETRDDVRQTLSMFIHSARCPLSTPQLNLLAPLAETPVHWKHRHELVLDELCSDASHQGRYQDEADLDLIRRYPEIFPNFYLLPTPNLDRGSLIELREFSLMTTVRFRWLLCALDRATPDFLEFFEQWRERRLALRPALNGPDLRHYYRTEQFRDDLLAFVRGHPVAGTEIVTALLEYQQALALASRGNEGEPRSADVVKRGARLRWTDIPVREKHTRVLELSYDLQLIVEALKKRDVPCWKRGQYFYATREFIAGVEKLHQVSTWVGWLLMACDGNRTIQQVVEDVSSRIVEVDESEREYVLVQLVDGARAQGFIEIYRPKSRYGSVRSSSAPGRAAHLRPAI